MAATLKAWYYVHELAELSQQEGWRMRRWLKKHYPEILQRNGQDYFIFLHDLQRELPGLWNSILALESLRSRLGDAVDEHD